MAKRGKSKRSREVSAASNTVYRPVQKQVVLSLANQRRVDHASDVSRTVSLLSVLRKNTIKPTRLDSVHARNSREAARASIAAAAQEPYTSIAAKREVSAPVVGTNQVRPGYVKTETHKNISHLSLGKKAAISPSPKSSLAREQIRCKTKPDSKKASLKRAGTGPAVRKFVPWC